MHETSYGLALGNDVPKSAETRLWETVLIRAIQDALGEGNSLEMSKARSWIRNGGHNFKLVCDLADVDPNRLRVRLMEMMDKSELAA
ncbi:MAG: hypothetical protein HQL52_02480 [Magnetococcales bacterium]|nr:hypothetical protein [Magnetococcales bacterium]